MYNLGHAELTFWSPNIDVVQDLRLGRALMTIGEDPFTVGTYAANYVSGLHDVEGIESTDDPNSRPLKVAACCRHYAAYDIDNLLGIDRTYYDALVTDKSSWRLPKNPLNFLFGNRFRLNLIEIWAEGVDKHALGFSLLRKVCAIGSDLLGYPVILFYLACLVQW
ncbi:unnamed protein product [Fraxinus pennsylvanica]|uniref:Glycoside hydrolase family 3 N-terminal domain-containing protein n=1 Tax=Fraxinus pennsylvanica TaxID=56036 RepID=A0AAD1ZNS9_9LAMI|nr:unnamed protein product [Fraxinus pennsylvanica]